MTRTTELAASHADEIVALRRALHRVPEFDLDLPLTQRLVLDALTGLDLEITTGKELSSVTAVLRGRGGPGGRRGPAVLLRGDMDALPVTERAQVSFPSVHPGLMHACGHDLHTAGLVGAAKILHAMRDELAGDVVFMFQPGEESTGGAPIMIREGVLDAAGRRVVAAYGLHVTSDGQPLGVWSGRAGPLMAGCDQLRVRVIGAGGHGSRPQNALDPIPVACEMVTALQAMVTRQFDAFDPMVVTVGRIAGGTKENIIPDECAFDATVRTFSATARAKVERAATRLVEGIAQAHGLTAEVRYQHGYPVTVNDEGEHAFVVDTVTDLFGADRYAELDHPRTGAEDFSFVLREVPGTFVFLSACSAADPATAPTNHSPLAAFDDSVLADGAALLAELAVRRLARG
jgi:hippurate hydrolase